MRWRAGIEERVDPNSLVPGDEILVRPGERIAVDGTVLDGRAFITEAIARGAAAVLWEHSGFTWDERWEIPNLGIEDLRGKISEIAGHLFGKRRPIVEHSFG